MTFIEKYKNLKPKEVQNDIMRVSKPDNCIQCGQMTLFIEINAMAPFCSEECVDDFYNEYNTYIKQHRDLLNETDF